MSAITRLLCLASLALGLMFVGANAFADDASATTKPVDTRGSKDSPIAVPFSDKIVKVDGDADKWKDIAALPAPYAKKDASSVKLCWNEQGIFGLATVADKDIEVDTDTPWSKDCVELFVEKDFARADDKTPNSAQYILAPDKDKSPAPTIVVVAWGGDADVAANIESISKKTADGYTIEFHLSPKVLAPGKLADGTKIGLNFSIDDKGKSIEQFYSDKDADEGYHKPSTWGAVILKK